MHAVRQALHQFRVHPWFSAFFVLLLAIGIGANTTMFSVIHSVLLKPLPYPEPGELVLIRKQPTADNSQQPLRGELVTDKEFLAWSAAELPGFRSFAALTNGNASWRGSSSTENVSAASVTGRFFAMLGVKPFRGRLPGADDTTSGAEPVVALAYDFWQSRFGGRDDVIGTQLMLDNTATTVVGVLPPHFEFIDPAQVWRPLLIHEAAPSGPGSHRVQITLVRAIARMTPGADLAAAQAQLDQVSKRMWDTGPAPQPGQGGQMVRRQGPGAGPGETAAAATAAAPSPQGPQAAQGGGGNPARRMMGGLTGGPSMIVPLQEYFAGNVRSTLWLLFGAVGLVLLIGCANVANLQLARATVRRHELAIRTALGASRRQLALALFAESLAPALVGGVLGLVFSHWGIQLVRTVMSAQLPRMAVIEVDWTVASFAMALAVITGVVFGLAPVLQLRRLAAQEALHAGGRTGTSSPGRNRWRQFCVAFEIALALALAANAGLLLRSFLKLRAVNLGFQPEGVLTVTLPTGDTMRPDQRMMSDPASQERVFSRLRGLATRWDEALALVPGVKDVSIADRAPLSEFAMMFMSTIEGYTPDPSRPEPPFSAAMIDSDYFGVVGIPVREGRVFTEADGDGAPLVVVVNEAFGRRFFPGQSVVGRRVGSPTRRGEWATIVGVVGDTRRSATDNDPQVQVYFPMAQWPQSRMTALLRFDADEKAVGAAVLETLRKLDPNLPFDTPVTLAERIDRTLASRKLLMNLLVGFAASAVLLAAIGIFGVMAYSVAQRTHEFGVRMALGADRGRILGHVFTSAGAAVAAGVVGGIALGIGTSHFLASMLFSVSRFDPVTLGVASSVLAVVGLLAALVPALRAARVNPIQALRSE